VKRAYDELYVTSARRILSFALMSAVENYGVAVTEWLDGFVSSGIAAHLGRGNPVYSATPKNLLQFFIILDRQKYLNKVFN
jgi:hypothetical protein